MEIITKAKSLVPHLKSPTPIRGRSPQKGATVHLKELFNSHKKQFQETEVELYVKRESIRYYCVDLLWGQKMYQ